MTGELLRLSVESSSAWPLLARAQVPVECISVATELRKHADRGAAARAAGARLSETVRSLDAGATVVLLVASPSAFDGQLRSVRRRVELQGLAGVLGADAGLLDGQSLVGGFASMRPAGWKVLGRDDWGWACGLMAGLPGVGVVLEGEFSPERLTALSGTEFVGQGGEGPTGRGARLRAVLCGDHPRVRGALVVAGAFRDVDVVAEFHRVIEV